MFWLPASAWAVIQGIHKLSFSITYSVEIPESSLVSPLTEWRRELIRFIRQSALQNLSCSAAVNSKLT